MTWQNPQRLVGIIRALPKNTQFLVVTIVCHLIIIYIFSLSPISMSRLSICPELTETGTQHVRIDASAADMCLIEVHMTRISSQIYQRASVVAISKQVPEQCPSCCHVLIPTGVLKGRRMAWKREIASMM